jgi:4'-phosphopantetheinyl transferase
VTGKRRHPFSMDKPIHLWFAFPEDAVPAETARAYSSLLCAKELEQVRTLRSEKLRRESLTTRALVRVALEHCTSVPAASWRFRTNPHGKPELEPECGITFNVTNCPDLVACAIAQRSAIGIDAEPAARSAQILELAEQVFSPVERNCLAHLEPADRLGRALSLWTLKEAYLKARGTGMSLPLEKISFVFGRNGDIWLELDPHLGDKADRWQFCLLDHAGHRIALVAEQSQIHTLELWEVRPVTAPPKQPAGREVKWFPRREESS